MKSLLALLAALTAITASASPVWWGLWNSGQGLEQRAMLYSGTNSFAVRLTAQNSPKLVNGQISGVRFYLSDKTAVRSVQVWLSRSINGTPLLSQEVPMSDVRDVAHDGEPTVAMFSEAVAVLPASNPYASIFAGFTLELDDAPLSYMLTGTGRGPAFSNYYNGTDFGTTYGPLALQVMAEGPAIAQRDITLQTISEQTAIASGEGEFLLTVTNEGSETLRSVAYQVAIDGIPQEQRESLLEEPVTELGRQTDIAIHYATPGEAREHALQIGITAINGEQISATIPEASPSATATLIVLDREPLKRTVMEEFTGTWCHNCIRGFAGIEKLQKLFGDRFIAIAMHSDDPALDRDPMTVSHYRNSTFYEQKSAILGGLPACTIDRWIDCDPYCGYLTYGDFLTDQLVAEALSRRPVADVELSATFTSEAQTAVEYNVKTTFRYSSDNAHYRLILVLTADSLTGEGRRWRQSNGYNDYAGTDEDLLQYAGRGQYITDMVYNHVAVDITGVNDGIEGSIATPIAAGEAQLYHYTLDIASNTIIQDKSQLNAIAMLIDTRDNSVVNAAIAHVAGDDSQDGIKETTPDNNQQYAPATIFDLQGRGIAPSQTLRNGFYIRNGRKLTNHSSF